jgi:hypothetical protein
MEEAAKICEGEISGAAEDASRDAAPDLLEALQSYLAWADNTICLDADLRRAIRENARAAIAKATGGAK